MTPTSSSPDLLVIGAGLIGLAVAREAASRGLKVTLVDRGEPGGGASWAAAGMLSPLSEAMSSGPYLRFSLSSLRMYREWVAELEEQSGAEVEYRECGKLALALSREEEEKAKERLQWAREVGIDAELLNGEEVRRHLPGVTNDVRSALLIHDDFRVSGRKLARALAKAARNEGVEIRQGTAVSALRSEGGRAVGVSLASGATLHSERVLLAAGAWSGAMDGLSIPLPIRPVRGQMLALHPREFPLARVIQSEKVYLVPREDGRILVGATVEEVGFREGNTAGGIRHLLSAAVDLFPALEESPMGEIWSGLRPATIDGYPILGKDPDMEGLFHASGHFRNGVLLAPATAQAIISLVTERGGETIPDEFSPSRFGTGAR